MTPLQFAQLWRTEKEYLLSAFLDANSQSAAAVAAAGLGLSPDQLRGLRELLDLVLTDTMYTLILGLDGVASIGERQESYRLFSESGDQLTGEGRLEESAWEVFHGEPEDVA